MPNKDKNIVVRATAEFKAMTEKMAREQGLTVTDYLTSLIEADADRAKSKIPDQIARQSERLSEKQQRALLNLIKEICP